MLPAPDFDRRALPSGAAFTSFPARDGWPLRRFDWPQTGKVARGSLLFQTGRGDMIEKYLETLAHWHAQGWAITGFDWRGQGGSGRLLADLHVGHIDDFKTWTSDLGYFWQEWIKTAPSPRLAVGHSMGGHLILRGLMEGQIATDAMILSAPMLGFEAKFFPVGWIAKLVNLAARIWPQKLAWPENERPSRKNVKRRSYLTHDNLRYEDESWWREQNPELVLGPPSLKWLAASYRSMQWMAADHRLEAIRTPILIVGTDGDKLVSPAAIRHFASRIPEAHLKMFGDESAHEIFREVDAIRDEALDAVDAFVAATFTK